MVTYLRNKQAVSWPGLEPETRRSQVQRSNHYTTEPPNVMQIVITNVTKPTVTVQIIGVNFN